MTTPDADRTATVDEVVAGLTLEQKASLASGASMWRTEAVPGVPSILVTDGPHGLRLQDGAADHLGLGASVPATCFPPAVALGSSFDPDLAERVGAALGAEAQSLGVQVVLGPGINIKRSLLCGRNFEYLSEDPLVSGVLGAAMVRGIQSQGVGASLKHFAANSQETDRFRVSADVDERPLREIYLRAFERVVREAEPWTVMCSYNRVNGVHASRNPWLLTVVLRDEWGFGGVVVSDWGAVVDRVDSAVAGLDLEMPGNGGRSDAELVAAVRAGSLDEAVLDRMAARVVALVRRATAAARPDASYDVDAHHALAREAAAASVVLLQNESYDGAPLLPLRPEGRIAVVGELARTPRYQGAGSSQVEPTRLDDALTSLRARLADVGFAPGYRLDGEPADDLVAEATATAGDADVVVLFLGLPAGQESEGFDRDHLELPADQLALLDAVLAVNPRVVVVLSNGGVVRLSGLADRVPAIVEGWLLGQAGGAALADVLTGAVDPSGRLAETIPERLLDSPAALDFGGEHGRVRYGEGLHVGYRWYDARDLPVSFPFGHGLSYTTFAWSDVTVETTADATAPGLAVRVTLTNTGDRAGAEVVQVYASRPGSAVVRPPRELVGFGKVALEPGESRVVTVPVGRHDLAYWDTRLARWVVEPGPYDVHVAASSRDVRATVTVELAGDDVTVPLHAQSTIAEVLERPAAAAVLADLLGGARGLLDDPALLRAMGTLPIGRLGAFGLGLTPADVAAIVAAGAG